jgi:hypothetical protein
MSVREERDYWSEKYQRAVNERDCLVLALRALVLAVDKDINKTGVVSPLTAQRRNEAEALLSATGFRGGSKGAA